MCTQYLLEYFQNSQYSVLTQVLFLSTGFIPDHIVTNSNTVLVVRRIKEDLIDTLDFQSKLEIAISASVLFESETESKQKISRNKVRFHCSFAFRWIPNTKTLNTQFKIPN